MYNKYNTHVGTLRRTYKSRYYTVGFNDQTANTREEIKSDKLLLVYWEKMTNVLDYNNNLNYKSNCSNIIIGGGDKIAFHRNNDGCGWRAWANRHPDYVIGSQNHRTYIHKF